jgi:hypothetical protein
VPFDPEVTALAVRTTARISAVLLAVNLIVTARRLAAIRPAEPDTHTAGPGINTSASSRPGTHGSQEFWGWSDARTLDLATFAAFLVSHTVHFASVASLAFATDGASIRDTGGWIAAMVVATLFFLSTWGVFRGKRRVGDRWTSTWSRRREIIVLTVIWLIFFQAYALRFGRPLFAVLAAGLLYSLVRLLVAARQPSSVVRSVGLQADQSRSG